MMLSDKKLSPVNLLFSVHCFNPEYVGNVDVTKQVMIGSVDFTGHKEMYEKFSKQMKKDLERNKFTIFDDRNYTVWIMWYEDIYAYKEIWI